MLNWLGTIKLGSTLLGFHFRGFRFFRGFSSAFWLRVRRAVKSVASVVFISYRIFRLISCISAGTRLLDGYARGRGRLGYYMNCLVSLAFEVGLRTRQLDGPRRVFSFNAPRGGVYELAADGWV